MATDVVTVIVEVPDPETVVGLKLADAPVGRPLTLKATLELKPPSAFTFTVNGALPPWIADPELGVMEMVKSVTLSVTDMVCVELPLAPCTVIESEPPAAPLVVIFRVALPGTVTGLPVKLAVTPAGSTLVTVNATLPVNPVSELTLIV